MRISIEMLCYNLHSIKPIYAGSHSGMITVLEKPIPFGGGIQLSPNKAMSLEQPLTKAKLPGLIKIPLRQHIGLPALPIIKVGDQVLKGQIIAKEQGSISASVHASTSGIIKEIAEHLLPNPSGAMSPCIVIEADGEDKWIENRTPVVDFYSLSPVKIQQKILEAGVVGLGGAGFPSAVKIIPGFNLDIELLILNAAECEPYISCDETLIRHYAKDVIAGVEILAHALQAEECVIAIEDNKTEAINALQESLDSNAKIDIKLRLVSSLYPAGGEKQLIKSITGIEVAAEGLPVDVGVVCYNVGTAVAVKKAIIDDEPLISRIVTITGPGINQARNLEVLLGTPMNEVIEQCGGYNDQYEYLIIGGPMMGFRLYDDDVPVIKTTNCLLAVDSQLNNSKLEESPCIRCDECAPVCPVKLQPQQLHWHSKELNIDRLLDYHLFDCIECGCCSYVCPSHISLVDEYRQSKNRIWDNRRNQLDADQNKQRYLNKQKRTEQQKLDKRNKHSMVDEEHANNDSALKKKQDDITAAVNRVKAKRKNKNN
jgi:H+/Na+-translocating ferredoxin:NAD+ oxidoreductase subunit C